MDYEQKYKTALETAKGLYNSIFVNNDILEQIFPELGESDDEKIKKWLIGYFNQYTIDGMPVTFGNGLNVKDITAWIEKQGNNDVKPKFKVGDYIKHNTLPNFIAKVISINGDSYGIESIEKHYRAEYYNAEQNFHLWTIQDVKDGDVLAASDDSVFIFESVSGNACVPHVALPNNGKLIINRGLKLAWETVEGVKPATKEQRDTLFAKIKEAGYEWVDHKKELIKLNNSNEPNFIWHSIDEEPEEMREIFCEWETNDATWHDVVYYHADTKSFWDGELQIDNVVKWVYVDEMLKSKTK